MMFCVNCERPVTYIEKANMRCRHCGKDPDVDTSISTQCSDGILLLLFAGRHRVAYDDRTGECWLNEEPVELTMRENQPVFVTMAEKLLSLVLSPAEKAEIINWMARHR
jgi:hypothetical protein